MRAPFRDEAQRIDIEIQQATERALKSKMPEKGSATRFVYSDTVESDVGAIR